MRKISIFILCAITLPLFAQDKPAYSLFNEKGKTVKYAKMLKAIEEADMVFFGELHDNPICHWLQLELTKDLHERKETDLILGGEFFESDNQLLIDEYLSGAISEKNFEAEVKLWPNYTTDYKPLLQFAKDNNLKFVASNVPRRYASRVYKQGIESLEEISEEAKAYLPPLPIVIDLELPAYQQMLEMGMGHGGDNIVKAQALKDATMAHFILEYYTTGKLVLHYNGSYHSNSKEGIIWYLLQANPDLKIVNIASVMQEGVSSLEEESLGIADFILCIPENMTRTH